MMVTRPARWILIAAITWGAFAFGAVYPWAYWPLTLASVLVAALGLCVPAPDGITSLGLASLGVALAVFIAAVAIQVIPLPFGALRAISPDALGILEQLDPTVRAGISTWHSLSIVPVDTRVGLALVASLSLLVVGAARLFSVSGVRATVRSIVIVGVVLALTGIVQKPFYTAMIYGLWTPNEPGDPYGPFLNKNHFAGWMLMTIPLTLGLLCGGVARGMRGVRPDTRERILWLSSPEASHLVLFAAAAALMMASLVLTMSRSGMSAALAVLVITGALALRRFRSTSQKVTGLALLTIVLVVAVGWTGAGAIAQRFSTADWTEINNRRGAWADAVAIARRYPLAGTGLNTYGQATLFYQQHQLSVHYSQAHNDYLQLAAEGGLLLTVPAGVCILALGLTIRRRFREETSTSTYWLRAGAVTGMFAVALQDTVEFSLQMPGNALLFAVLCAIAVHRTAEKSTVAGSRRRISDCSIEV
jgi:hypothetical protein